MEIYREANRRARSAPVPSYFSKAYVMERIIYASSEPDSSARDHLRQMIAETQELLKQQIAAIHEAFDRAMTTYSEIDKLLPNKSERASG